MTETRQEVHVNLKLTLWLPATMHEEDIGVYVRNGIYAGFKDQTPHVGGNTLLDILDIKEEAAIYGFDESTITEVIFRRFKSGELIALFPALPGTNDYHGECLSYMTVGQHGAASVNISRMTQPAFYNVSDVVKLRNELKGIGYNLKIVQRFTRKHFEARKAAVENINSK